jgi:hypothetical protein
MSDFLANLARRGAGLALHVPLQPSLTPFVPPEAGAAGPIEHGPAERLEGDGRPAPLTPPLLPDKDAAAGTVSGVEHGAEEPLENAAKPELTVQRQVEEPPAAQSRASPGIAPPSPIPAPIRPTSSSVVPAATPPHPAPTTATPSPGESDSAQPRSSVPDQDRGSGDPLRALKVDRAERPVRTQFSSEVRPSQPVLAPKEPTPLPPSTAATSSPPSTPDVAVEVRDTPSQPIQATLEPAQAATQDVTAVEKPAKGENKKPVSSSPPAVEATQEPSPRPAGPAVEIGASPTTAAESGSVSPGLVRPPTLPSASSEPSGPEPGRPPPTRPTAHEGKTVVQIEPALLPAVTVGQAIIGLEPTTPKPSPVPPASVGSATTPESRPVQVHIGTIEVRATTPPPVPAPQPPPAPQGFDDYVHIRTYRNWDTG